MTPRYVVVEASVAVKWLVLEHSSDRALALLGDCLQGDQTLGGPPHLLGECTSAIFQRYRSVDPTKHMDRAATELALAQLLAYPIEIISPPGLYEPALDFAVTHRLSAVYDALYIVLAQMLGAELWTADRRLLTALASAAPWVRDFAGYPAP